MTEKLSSGLHTYTRTSRYTHTYTHNSSEIFLVTFFIFIIEVAFEGQPRALFNSGKPHLELDIKAVQKLVSEPTC